MAFANFSDFWGFLDFLTILSFFDDFLKTFWPTCHQNLHLYQPIILDPNLGHTSWRVCWWACPEHPGKGRGNLASEPVLYGQVIKSPDAQSKRSVRLPVKKDGSTCRWLGWLSTSSIVWLLILVYLESLEAKSEGNAKLVYSMGTFVRASSAIKLALRGLRDGWTPSSSSGYFGWLRTIEPTFCSTALLPLSAPASPPPTTLLSSTLEADAMNDSVVFNIAVSDIVILLWVLDKTLVEICETNENPLRAHC